MMKHLFMAAGMLGLVLIGCAPQAELVKTRSDVSDVRDQLQISRTRVQELQKSLQDLEKRVDTIDANVKGTTELQKVTADYGARTDQLTTDIQLLQGRLEENNFRIAELGQKLDDRSFKIAELSARVDELETRLKTTGTGQGITSGGTGTGEKKAGVRSMEPTEAYRQALNDYNSGNYELALAGFQNYLMQFPDASQADKAQYWIGECLYAKKDFKASIDAFSKVIKTYPKSDKVPGAKLKIGYAYMSDKNNTKAREWLNKVIKEHPDTQEAILAREKVRKLGK